MTKRYDHLFKILLAGDSGTGKTALLCRFADDTYSSLYISTIGIDFKIRTVERDGKVIKLQIWDTAGQDRFRSITTAYYRGAHCILLVFSLADTSSFDHLDHWLRNVKEHAPDDVLRVLVGNKSDLPCSVDQSLIVKVSGDHGGHGGLGFFRTSAKDSTGVKPLFDYIVTELMHRAQREKEIQEQIQAQARAHAPPVTLVPVPPAPRKNSWCLI
jgi:small GTP-binding protein